MKLFSQFGDINGIVGFFWQPGYGATAKGIFSSKFSLKTDFLVKGGFQQPSFQCMCLFILSWW